MSGHTGGMGNFSQATASPYAQGLEALLTLVYLDAEEREKNFEMQAKSATAESLAAKGMGQAQEEAAREESESMKYQAVGEITMGSLTMGGTALAIKGSSMIGESKTLSLNGDAVAEIDGKVGSLDTWDDAFKKTAASDVRLEAGNVEVGGELLTQERLNEKMAEFRNVDKSKVAFKKEDEAYIAHAKNYNQNDIHEMHEQVQLRKTKLADTREERMGQSKLNAFTQWTQITQALGQALQGVFTGCYAASHKAAAGQAQNLQAQMQFSFDSIKRGIDSASQTNANTLSRQQALAQVMEGMARVSYVA